MLQLRQFNLLVFLPLLLLVSGCTHNPVRTAQTPEQKGDAWYGVYVIAKEQGAAILNDAAVPDAAKRPLAETMVKSAGPAGTLQDTVIAYGRDPSATAAQKISAALVAAQPLINDLVAALVRVKPDAQPLADQLEELK